MEELVEKLYDLMRNNEEKVAVLILRAICKKNNKSINLFIKSLNIYVNENDTFLKFLLLRKNFSDSIIYYFVRLMKLSDLSFEEYNELFKQVDMQGNTILHVICSMKDYYNASVVSSCLLEKLNGFFEQNMETQISFNNACTLKLNKLKNSFLQYAIDTALTTNNIYFIENGFNLLSKVLLKNKQGSDGYYSKDLVKLFLYLASSNKKENILLKVIADIYLNSKLQNNYVNPEKLEILSKIIEKINRLFPSDAKKILFKLINQPSCSLDKVKGKNHQEQPTFRVLSACNKVKIKKLSEINYILSKNKITSEDIEQHKKYFNIENNQDDKKNREENALTLNSYFTSSKTDNLSYDLKIKCNALELFNKDRVATLNYPSSTEDADNNCYYTHSKKNGPFLDLNIITSC